MYSCSRHIMRLSGYLLALLFLPGINFCQDFDGLLRQAKISDDSAAFYFSKAAVFAKTTHQKARYSIANSDYYQSRGKSDSAVLFARQAIAYAEKVDSTAILIHAYKNLCKEYNNNGDYTEAVDYGLKGLNMAEKLSDYPAMIWFNNSLSLSHHDFEDYEKGVAYGKSAYEYSQKATNIPLNLTTYPLNSIAINFDDWGKPDSALYYHYKILEHVQDTDTVDYYFTYNNIGNTLIKQGKYAEAEKWLNRSLATLDIAVRGTDTLNFFYDYATTLTNLSTIAYKYNQFDEAEKLFDRAAYFVNRSNSAEKKRDYFHARYLFNKTRGNIEETVKYQENYILLRDSIFNAERARSFAELEKKYQTEKKEAEIRLLGMNNLRQRNFLYISIGSLLMLAIIGWLSLNRKRLKEKSQLQQQMIRQQDAAAKAVINAEESERQRMSLTLHDGLGQLLSVVKMNLQAVGIQAEAYPKILPVVNKTLDLVDNSITEMRNVSHQIVPTSVIRSGLAVALRDLIEKVDANQLEVNLEMEGLAQEIDADIQLVLYRVYQESINNVLKHAKADKLDIVLKVDEKNISGSIADNGVGFDLKSNLAKGGIGLENIQARIRFLKGNLSVDSSPGNGTNIRFDIPQE